MEYTLGLDIGISSIGFAGINAEHQKILFCNAHIFEAAENPKEGASLAKTRREKRGARRNISRTRLRKKRIRTLLKSHGIEDINHIGAKTNKQSNGSQSNLNVWQLRALALERKLTDGEFAKVLFHIAKRRGFQSNKKGTNNSSSSSTDSKEKELKKALDGAQKLRENMVLSHARTIGAYLAQLPIQRNGNDSYDRFVTRDLLREEVGAIFEAQRSFGNLRASRELQLEYAGTGELEKRYSLEGDGIAFCQRPLQSSYEMVGYCTLEKEQKRAPKSSYSAELFVMWSHINNLRVKDRAGYESELTQKQKVAIARRAHKNKGGVTYKAVRKILELTDDQHFNISYRKVRDKDKTTEAIRGYVESKKFVVLQGYHELKAVLEKYYNWDEWVPANLDRFNEIARVLSFYEDKTEIHQLLGCLRLGYEQIEELCEITSFRNTVNLSLKAIKSLLPFMLAGERYDEACQKVGYHHSSNTNKGLDRVPPFDDTKNPVVNRALAQSRKVINACIRIYGMPKTIIVEMGRDIGKSFTDRKKIQKEQEKYRFNRIEIKKHASEILEIPEQDIREQQIIKFRLWQQQQQYCPYSGEYISPEMLRDNTATQIDHILPFSRCWNNRLSNKVLCLTAENQKKVNRTPFEYLHGTEKWEKLKIMAAALPREKAEKLLIENFSEQEQSWRESALNDTQYAARLLKNHLSESLSLGEGNRVRTVNGMLTATLRSGWGFAHKNRENDRHHALDAIVIACTTQAMVQKFTNWNKYEFISKHERDKYKPKPPMPWDSFRRDSLAVIDNLFISRQPVRKTTGAAHDDTVRSIRKSDNKIVQRVKLKDLTINKLENMVDKERNIKLYNILSARLLAYEGKGKNAFFDPKQTYKDQSKIPAPVYMPCNKVGKKGPEVHSIRIETNEKSGKLVNEGLARNGKMVRVDVFKKNGKYFLVPIYVKDFATDFLPNNAIIPGKDETEWEEMQDEDFIFSLYKNDLVRIQSKKENILAYYNATDRSNASITLTAHDRDPSFGKDPKNNPGKISGKGVKSLLKLEKYIVDYFGNKTIVSKEKRIGVAHRAGTKTSKTKKIKEST